jgi:hypothetical protein
MFFPAKADAEQDTAAHDHSSRAITAWKAIATKATMRILAMRSRAD